MRDNVEMTQPTLTIERLVLSAPTGDDVATIYEQCQDPVIQKFVIPIGPKTTSRTGTMLVRLPISS